MNQVKRNDSEGRYEIHPGEGEIATLSFSERNERLILTHTEVPPALEGNGIGGRLVQAAAADARERGLKVVPQCSFARAWFQRHPDEDDVLAKPRED